jgi:ABC-type glycerol-3-phosphate transport system permease component
VSALGATGGRRRLRPRRVARPAVWNTLGVLVGILFLFPVYWMVATAFKPGVEIFSLSPHWWPHSPTLENFRDAINRPFFWDDVKYSFIITLTVVALSCVLALLAAVAIGKFGFYGRRGIIVLMIGVQMVPLVAPGLVATSVFAFIQAWNEYVMAYVLLQDQRKQTLTVWLANFTTQKGTEWGPLMAGATLTALPVVVFFVLVQRRLAAGITAGAVRGCRLTASRPAPPHACSPPSRGSRRRTGRCAGSRRASAGSSCSPPTCATPSRWRPCRHGCAACGTTPSSRSTRRAATSPGCSSAAGPRTPGRWRSGTWTTSP